MSLRKAAWRTYARWRRRVLGIPQPGHVNFGDLRRLTPISRGFGTERGVSAASQGKPIDRYFIESFLGTHAADIQGAVLEIGDRHYTQKFGGSRVSHSDVLNVVPGNPDANIVADLADAPHIADATYDCVILTQTLHYIYDTRSAIETVHRILRPGGILLVTVPGISQVAAWSVWGHTWYWTFTRLAMERLLGGAFGGDLVRVQSIGNVLVVTAFLHGLSLQEVEQHELGFVDPDYPLIVAARAEKRSEEAQLVSRAGTV